MTYARINISELYMMMNRFEVSRDFGYVSLHGEDTVFITPSSPEHMIAYCIAAKCGTFRTAQVVDDLDEDLLRSSNFEGEPVSHEEIQARLTALYHEEESRCEQDNLCISLAKLRETIDNMCTLGVYRESKDAQIPEHIDMLVLRGIDTNTSVEQIVENMITAIQRELETVYDQELMTEGLNKYFPQFIYAGEFTDYRKFREANEKIGAALGSSIMYHNIPQWLEIKSEVETAAKNKIFEQVLSSCPIEVQYVFSPKDQFIRKFATRIKTGDEWESTYYSAREATARIQQVFEFYTWILNNSYTVFSFDIACVAYELDRAFYAVLAIAQHNLHIKVLLPNATAFTQSLLDICNMPYADFPIRQSRMRELYGRNKLRLLKDDKNSIARFGVTRDYKLNIRFMGISLENAKRCIQRDKTGKWAITMDSFSTSSEAMDILTNQKFSMLNANPNNKIWAADPLPQIVKSVETTIDSEGFCTDDLEDYVYCLCRLIDQVLHGYNSHTTLRDLTAYVIQQDGSSVNKCYIGWAQMAPELECDVIVLNAEGILIPAIKYTGKVLDVAWVDDLNLVRFRDGILSLKSTERFIDRIAKVYEAGGRVLAPEIKNLEQSCIKPQTGKELLLSILYAALCTLPTDLYTDIYKVAKECKATISDDEGLLQDPLLPFYLGLVVPRNYLSNIYMRPYVLELTTNYGYRQVSRSDSPLNIFGGLNLDRDSTLWMYPALFQHHKREATVTEGDYGK